MRKHTTANRAAMTKMAVLVTAGLGALAVGQAAHTALTGSGGGGKGITNPRGAGTPITVRLHPVNGYHQSGVAILTPTKTGITVTVKITAGKAADGEDDHIHDVSCARYAKIAPHPHAPTGAQMFKQLATLAFSLTNLRGGRSVTRLTEPLAAVTTGGYSINVHITNSPYTAVACGDIPRTR